MREWESLVKVTHSVSWRDENWDGPRDRRKAVYQLGHLFTFILPFMRTKTGVWVILKQPRCPSQTLR
jgi:hypothetical protein